MPTKYGLPLINFINSKLAQKDPYIYTINTQTKNNK